MKGSLRKRLSSPHLWVASTYFAEGYPYTVVNTLAEVLFKELGASLKAIGLTALLHLPWNLKFLWGPFADRYATKRSWLIWTEVGIVSVILALALVAPLPNVLTLASALFLALAFLSATHDIAIDGYYLEALDKKGQSRFVGYRVTAYRVAMLVVSGPLVVFISKVGWPAGFVLVAALMALLLFYHATWLPRVETPGVAPWEMVRAACRVKTFLAAAGLAMLAGAARYLLSLEAVRASRRRLLEALPFLDKISVSEWIALAFLAALLVVLAMQGRIRRWIDTRDSFYADAFVDFLAQRQVGRILAFVILFRTGESFLLKMRYAFLRDIGMTMEQFGIAGGTFGVVASLAATMAGGYLISRDGLERWLWPFVLMQNVLQLLYMAVSYYYVDLAQAGVAPLNYALLTLVITVEAFGAGFGTAVFMVYIMRCCRPRYKAAHMAILTALMSLSFTFAGVASGFLAEWMGYTLYFGFTFVAAVPGMVLLFFIPYLDGTTASDAPECSR